MKKMPPKFTSEEQERKFWGRADSADYIDWWSAKRVVLPNLKPTQQTISLRLPSMMLSELKRLANKRDVPYQSLLKVFLAERLEQELRPPNDSSVIREKRVDYPPSPASQHVKKLRLHELPPKHRCWTGNDANQRNHNGRIPSGENPVFLELRWKKDKHAAEKLVGGFEIDVEALVREGYLAPDPAGGIRLKFMHGSDGKIYLGRGLTREKKIRVGRA
jgi:predicted DNA binding CopG/RHH family protein